MSRSFSCPSLPARFSIPAMLALAACLAPVVTAQESAPAPTTPAAAQQARGRGPLLQPSTTKPAEADRPLLSVDFRGGTVAEFVEVVKAASPVPVNVVGPVEVMKMPVPAISLKNVTPFMALQTLEYVNDRRPSTTSPGGMASSLQVLDLNRSEPNNTQSQTFAIAQNRNQQFVTSPLGPAMAAASEAGTTQVYAVRDLLGGEGGLPGLSMEQIVEPLEAALNVDAGEGGEPAKLMVHKASNLILVRGTVRQNALVRQVLDRLREDTIAARASTTREREQSRIAEELKKQYEVRQRMLEMQTAEQEKRLADLRSTLERLRRDGIKEDNEVLTASIHETESNLSTLQKQMAQNKMQAAEVPFEASRQARSANSDLVGQLRAEIDSLRKQIEDLRAVRSGPK